MQTLTYNRRVHRVFRKELDGATGQSEFVVAQVVDIRGFSDWSLRVDSAQTALYIKKVYARLIDGYFDDGSFIKPTGDGLLVVKPFVEVDLFGALESTIRNALEIVEKFSSLVSDEPMINFDVPPNVGIGIARGSASRLASGDTTLDYSGRPLNLASRLMELARPRGVVVDDGFGLDLLPPDLVSQFRAESVFIKDVAPNDAMVVHCWPAEIKIADLHRRPIGEETWEHRTLETTRRDLERSDVNLFRFDLDPAPMPGAEVECRVSHEGVTPGKRKSKRHFTNFSFPITQSRRAGQSMARFDQHELAEHLREAGVGPSWPVTVRVSYRLS